VEQTSITMLKILKAHWVSYSRSIQQFCNLSGKIVSNNLFFRFISCNYGVEIKSLFHFINTYGTVAQKLSCLTFCAYKTLVKTGWCPAVCMQCQRC